MKKTLSILATLICVFALTACSEAKAPARISGDTMDQQTEAAWVSSGEQVVGYMQQIQAAGVTADVEADETWGPAMQSWMSSIEDIGTVEGFQDEYAVASGKDQVTISIGLDGSDHDADVVIVADQKDSGVEVAGITTNVRYSMGELIEQAALNTVLGMGTTFTILILLAILISLFAFIPKIQAAFTKKPAAEEKKAAPAPAAAPAPVAAQTDDSELIAVIAAAIAASEGRTSTDGFVVRSIRKARKKY